MPYEEPPAISIALSPAQVDAVVRAATHSRAPSVSTLIGSALRAPVGDERSEIAAGSSEHDRCAMDGKLLRDEDADPRMSRSLLRGLSLLTRFGPDGAERGIVELARELGMSPSTAHRYAFTLVELGLLERSPRTRKYRLPNGK
jgi:IclR helix-turn-helix domain